MKRRQFFITSALGSLIPATVWSAGAKQPLEDGFIEEPSQKIAVAGEYDVIVCGAGPAGVSAAIESTRNGAKTLVIEVNGCLGGVWTAGLLTWILDHVDKPGLMREIEARLKVNNGYGDIDTGSNLSFEAEVMKYVLEEMCADAGVDILYHTRAVGASKDAKGNVSHIITESTSGRQAWAGKVFVDASGNADLAYYLGCGFDIGRKSDNAVQPFSLLAIVTGVEFDQIRSYTRWQGDKGQQSKKKLLQEIVNGGFLPSYKKPGLYPIRKDLYMLMANHEYGYNPLDTRQLTTATINARKEVNGIVQALRKQGGVWSGMKLVATAEHIGIREARRVHGIYSVTKEDLIEGIRHKDAVCRVGFGVDVHSVKKEDESKGSYSQGIKSKPYDIPLRALISKDVGNLMMAGRCISGDFISHSSYRVTGNSVPMGQAAGRTAAIAAKQNINPAEVNWEKIGWKLD